jgi:hypothetical protein
MVNIVFRVRENGSQISGLNPDSFPRQNRGMGLSIANKMPLNNAVNNEAMMMETTRPEVTAWTLRPKTTNCMFALHPG